MAILDDVEIMLGEYRITTDLHSCTLSFSSESQPNTRFGDTARVSQAGLATGSFSAEGYFAAGASPDLIDTILRAKLATDNIPLSIAPNGDAEGAEVYFLQASLINYTPIKGAVGDAHNIDLSCENSGDHIVPNGRIEKGLGSTTATFQSTGSQLGAVTANDALFGILHVISGTGTLDIDIESDNASDFVGATVEKSFTQATGATSEFVIDTAAVTNTWWRINATLASTPDFSMICAIGIRAVK